MNDYLAQLTAMRTAALAKMRALVDRSETENRSLSVAEQQEFDQLSTDMDSLGARAERLRATERSDAATAAALERNLGGNGNGNGSSTSWLPNRREYEEMKRSTGYSNAAAVLPTTQYGQWFDKLRPRSVVLAALPLLVPVEGHAIDLPTLTGSATVGNYLENVTITASDPTLAKVTLTPIKFAALVHASHEAGDDSSGVLGRILTDDLLRSTATAADVEFLAGPGTAGRVRGLKNIAGATVVSSPTNGAVPSLDTVLDLITSLEALGSELANIAVFLTPGVWSALRRIKGVTGGTYLMQPDPTEPARPSLFGVRIFPTANLSQTETQGSSSVTSTIIAADMSRIAVGVGKDVNIQVSDDFHFDQDQSSYRVTARFDLAAINANAVALALGNKVA